MAGKESENVTLAKNILRGEIAKPKDILELAKRLKSDKAFDYARKILSRASDDSSLKQNRKLFLEISQQYALCTYKDPNLSDEKKFDDALKILDDTHVNLGENLRTTKNQESLGLAGAIHKYKWSAYGQKQYLEIALVYYLRGYKEGVESDYGYTGINAAFMLDLLASLESEDIETTEHGVLSPQDRREEAKSVRLEIVKKLTPILADDNKKWLKNTWWFLVTVAEAYFGLRQYDDAGSWLKEAAELKDVPEWEKESTTRQLASIAHLQIGDDVWKKDFEKSEAYKVLKILLGKNAIRGALLGKVGLALSGGGFRASLYHIGVLARLAELDILRHVEVISCVSGGSIIGAYYYLELRKLLSGKRKEKDTENEKVAENDKATENEKITQNDYIEIIKRITDRFIVGVQRNLRTRVAAELITNLKMIFLPNYSRTLRIGELYEKELYSLIDDGEGHTARWLNNLFIKPDKEPDTFSPKYQNWRMEAKIPMLILNATTLNTGHIWQFTASWMGEPPSGVNAEIDANFRLRRMYYGEAPDRYKNMRLGYAVAASSCVPGLFEPISFPKLYPKNGQSKITVRLVDGGVHDNQGVASLLEQDCSLMIVSDASGQMESQEEPSKGILGVPLRSNSILMSRVREAEYSELNTRRRYSALRGFMFVHLKKGLDVKSIDWVNCQDPPEDSDRKKQAESSLPSTEYGINKEIQEAVAGIRTDLDSFSYAEAYALMMSGYSMTEYEFPRSIPGYKTSADIEEKWDFQIISGAMKKDDEHIEAHKEILELLKVGSNRAFKIWKLSTTLKFTAWIGGILLLAAILWVCWHWSQVSLLSLGNIGIAIIVLLLSLLVGKTIIKIVRFRETLMKIGIGIGMSLLGWILARIHLRLFDWWFLRHGKVNRLINMVKNK